MEDMNQISQAIVDGKLELAQELVGKAIESGMDAQSIIDDYLTAGMAEIGQRFQDRKAFVPNLLMSARAMKGALEVLKPHMSGRVESHVGTVVIGTVKGDLHDIGKNLVASMFEGCGFKVINLGIDVSSEKFVKAVEEHNADILCLSALLTTTKTSRSTGRRSTAPWATATERPNLRYSPCSTRCSPKRSESADPAFSTEYATGKC